VKLWTVVLKNVSGEYPYSVRATSSDEAIREAQTVFKQHRAAKVQPNRLNRLTRNPWVIQVVCWDTVEV